MQATGKVRTVYGEGLPPVAGSLTVGDDPGWKEWIECPATPPHIRKWRRGQSQEPGKRTVHPGLQDDAARVDPLKKFGGGAVKESDHVMDVWKQPGTGDNLDILKLRMKETVYHSSKREALGKGWVRGHKLPEAVEKSDFRFGIESDHSEAAKNLLYPMPTEGPSVGQDLYKRSHHAYAPGEQRRRGYDWDVDETTHTFGRSGGVIALNGASPSVQAVLRGEGDDAPKRVADKRMEDFRNTQDVLGRVRNLGFTKRDHLGENHVYGKANVRAQMENGEDEDAKGCVEGEYSWEEQQPDDDLGKAITPGFRNMTTESRAFGVPTVRSDITPPLQRSVADAQNFGDEVPVSGLVNPSQFSVMGIEDEELFRPRTKQELRSIFESIGAVYSDDVFSELWQKALSKARKAAAKAGEGAEEEGEEEEEEEEGGPATALDRSGEGAGLSLSLVQLQETMIDYEVYRTTPL